MALIIYLFMCVYILLQNKDLNNISNQGDINQGPMEKPISTYQADKN